MAQFHHGLPQCSQRSIMLWAGKGPGNDGEESKDKHTRAYTTG